jgi:hypothetical protein
MAPRVKALHGGAQRTARFLPGRRSLGWLRSRRVFEVDACQSPPIEPGVWRRN